MNSLANGKVANRAFVRQGVVAIGLSVVGFCPLAQAADSDGWQWIVAPYVWAVGFNTDLERSEPPAGGTSNDRTFDNVLDKFDGAFQAHIEGQEAHWGMLADFTYLGLSDEKDFPRFRTESDLDARLFDLSLIHI